MEQLTQKEIDRRMVEWRNDRRLEPERQRKMEELKTENKRFEVYPIC